MNEKISFHKACHILKEGGVVAVPTETVYGLAGSIQSQKALKQIFHIKKRPLFDPLIVLFAKKKQLKQLCRYSSPIVEKLSDYFHPGPLSLVLRKKSIVSTLITAGSNKVAVRMPRHPLTLNLIEKTNLCLAAPSANLFSKTSPTRASHVLESLQVPVLDGGSCDVGIESTILEIIEEEQTLSILRKGHISPSDLKIFLKKNNLNWKVIFGKNSFPVPGQSQRHYQPDVPFVIIQSSRSHLSSQQIEKKIKEHYPNLQPMELKLKKDPFIFSRGMYHNLRKLSKKRKAVGYVIKNLNQNEDNELWLAIWDRLEKASQKTIRIQK